MYGPDDGSMETYHREVAAYSALESLQGDVVPELLADRYILCGVHYLALSAFDGVAFSSLWPNITSQTCGLTSQTTSRQLPSLL
jgi:hypothetical protein